MPRCAAVRLSSENELLGPELSLDSRAHGSRQTKRQEDPGPRPSTGRHTIEELKLPVDQEAGVGSVRTAASKRRVSASASGIRTTTVRTTSFERAL